MFRLNRVLVIGFMAAALATTSCNDEGPAERAGEEVDEAAEEAKDTLGDAGERLEESGERLQEKTQ